MKLNKTFVAIMAIACVFALTGVAFANNRIEVKVTSEPLPEGTTCSKGGGFSLEFDTNTQITVGDQITIDLDYISSANNAKLCKDIDLEISLGGSAGGWTAAAILGNNSDGPVYYIDDTNDVDLLTGANSVYFRLAGTAGSQRITLNVMGTAGDFITVGNDEADRLVINFLDQKTNGTHFTFDGIYIDDSDPLDGSITDDKDGVYSTVAAVLHNTLCLNVSTFGNATVNGNMDSQNDKYTFIPSNPQIAHIAAPQQANAFRLAQCSKSTTGTIQMGAVQKTACLFDYERGTGYCADHVGDHRVIIESMYQVWDAAYTYTATLEILVNGQSGDHGVYFTAENVGLITAADVATHCNDADDTADNSYAATCQAGTNCAAVGTCSETNHTRITSATVGAGVITANNRFMWIDVPQMAYNTATAGTMITSGDTVTIRVTLGASNPGASICGTSQFVVGPYDVNVGTFGACGQNFALVYPYFVAATEANWWSGLAIVNMSTAAGNATVYIYEDDGDEARLTLTIPGNEMWVNLTSALFETAGMTTTPAGATIGDSRAYMVVCGDFNIDGFAMIGNNETGEGQGYLPRQPAVAPTVCNP